MILQPPGSKQTLRPASHFQTTWCFDTIILLILLSDRMQHLRQYG